MGGVEGYQGFAGNMVNKYSTIGNSGMTPSQIKNQFQVANEQFQYEATLEKQPERQAFCQMYGINAQQFDYNGNGQIDKKEFADIQKFVQRYGARGILGQQGTQGTSGYSNAFELLNSPEAKNILGTVSDLTGFSDTEAGQALSQLGNAMGGSSGSGGFLNLIKGLFS